MDQFTDIDRPDFHQRRDRLPFATPATVFLDGTDWLQVTTIGNTGSITLTISGRVLRPDGQLSPFTFTHVASSNRAAASTVVALPEGWLLGVSVIASTGTPLYGATWCRLQLMHGFSSAQIVIQALASGVVTATYPLIFPGQTTDPRLSGSGAVRAIVGTTPAAGAEVSETVPTGARWLLISFTAVLTTSAAAANRIPVLNIDDGTNVFFVSPSAVVEGANLTTSNTWWGGGFQTGGIQQTIVVNALGVSMLLEPGFRIRTVTSAIQAGDQYAAPKYLVIEWFDV